MKQTRRVLVLCSLRKKGGRDVNAQNLLNVTKNVIHCEFSDASHRISLSTACLSIRKNACCRTKCTVKPNSLKQEQIKSLVRLFVVTIDSLKYTKSNLLGSIFIDLFCGAIKSKHFVCNKKFKTCFLSILNSKMVKFSF